ncbi:MAG: aspartyl/asparaginyl beta-hydroxylase domain-containing protein [Bacteroidetes bacterium]|nr:aspartyl/asparaginyl beta-hydroxylase domain-containing protein [Bacteroidota bacterium]
MSKVYNEIKRKILTFLVEAVEFFIFFGNKDKAIIPNENYPELELLTQHFDTIKKEYISYQNKQDTLQYFDELSVSQQRIVERKKWQAVILRIYGRKVNKQAEYFQQTHQLLEKIPSIKTAFFSVFNPGTKLIPHRGPYKGVLRYHLGIVIPKEYKKCAINIDGTICHWQEGKAFIFDDTYTHEAWNDSEETRVILFIDIVRKLHFPFNKINDFFLFIIQHSPLVREIYSKAK